MNIPEITNEVKQGLRSENPVPAETVDKPPVQDGTSVHAEAVQKLEKTQADADSSNFSKEELNTLIEEAQEQLDANNVKLKFNVLEEADTVQVEIIDGEGKVIRKIPDDDLVKLSKSLKNFGQGFLDTVS